MHATGNSYEGGVRPGANWAIDGVAIDQPLDSCFDALGLHLRDETNR